MCAVKKVAVGALAAVLALLCGMLLAAPHTQDDMSLTGAAAKGLVLLDDEQGVYVLAVTDRSPAALAGVEPGDYLLSAGGLPIDKAQRLDEMMAQMQEPLLLRLRRSNAEVLITLPVRSSRRTRLPGSCPGAGTSPRSMVGTTAKLPS